MLFFFKSKPLVVDCFVPEEYANAVEYSPIRKSGHFIPKWFRDLPVYTTCKYKDQYLSQNDPSSENFHEVQLFPLNVRNCIGVRDLLTKGFILPIWSDLTISVDKDIYNWQFSNLMGSLFLHSDIQMAGYSENYLKFKIGSPWVISCSKKMEFVVLETPYHTNLERPYRMMPGLLSTISSHNVIGANSFMFVKRDFQKIFIEHNTPLVQYIPLTNERVDVRCHVDTSYYNKLKSIFTGKISFMGKGVRQKYIDAKLKK